jgi:Domain of unknown function (DUF1707)
MRASHTDRDRVIGALQDAYVQGRLTKDEFDSRIGQALSSRTHSDLAPLTSDLPAKPPTGRSPRRPAHARPKTVAERNSTRVLATTTLLTGSLWAVAAISASQNPLLVVLVLTFTFVWLGVALLTASVRLEERMRNRET